MAVLGVGILLLIEYTLGIFASYHWKVTENGRISSQVENSGFPLRKQDDLLALLEQELRLQTINKLYKRLMLLKSSIDGQWAGIEREEDFEKRLYSSDLDCLLGEVPLSQHSLNIEFLDYGQGSRPKMKNNSSRNLEPDCTVYSKLDFSMRTYPHLETLNKRTDFNLTVTPVPSKPLIDFNIDEMLKANSSDWTAYNVASFYWRTVGNATNALECAKRALYFSPRNLRYLVLLNLGTLLQELQSLGEAAIVLHSAVDHDPVQDVSHLALGNVYVALGDYQRSLACYENVLSLNPGNIRALHLKHALLCHRKLESGLLEIHSSLQRILKDLHEHNTLHEEWLHLQIQANWERNGKTKEFFSLAQPVYFNLHMLLQNVEHQAKTLNEEVTRRVPKKTRNGKFGSVVGERSDGHRKLVDLTRGEEISGKSIDGSDEENPERGAVFAREEESRLKRFVTSDYLFKNKIHSLISFVKSNYEEEINLIDFKREIKEEFNFLSRKSDACVKDSSDVKKLN